MSKSRLPITTVTVVAITAAATALQSFYPLLPVLERRPGALAAHEYWRLITPILLHVEGWRQIAFDFSALAVIGTIVERIFGGRRWLVLYLAGGVTGELAGFAWKPLGAGSSVAICGLLGGLAAWLLSKRGPIQPRFGGLVILAGAVLLCVLRDLHGPPLLVGMVLGGWMLRMKTASVPSGARSRISP